MDEKKLKIGGRYNWIGQPERLIYVGRKRYPVNGLWHQFEKVDEPGVIWCEVTNDQLSSFEETTDLLTEGEISSLDTVAWRHEDGYASPYMPKKRKCEPLVRRSDAEAIIAGLQGRIAALEASISTDTETIVVLHEKVDAKDARIAELEAGSEPVKFLLNGARLKLSFQEIKCQDCESPSGEIVCRPIDQYAKELQGRWVALVPAENDRHLRHAVPQPARQPPKANCVPLSEVIAELESTPEGKAAMDEAREWVRQRLYPYPTDRNAVIDSCVNAILEKGALEDGEYVAALRALKTNAGIER